ncbi:NAB domain-containing protein [Psidium guajava]|nr:NAB domain-containing protein [Psidium guajava]
MLYMMKSLSRRQIYHGNKHLMARLLFYSDYSTFFRIFNY